MERESLFIVKVKIEKEKREPETLLNSNYHTEGNFDRARIQGIIRLYFGLLALIRFDVCLKLPK